MTSLKQKYTKEVIPKMKEKFGYKNDLAVPKILKAVVNTGFNPDKKNEKIQEEISNDIALITGQKPSSRQVKKAEAGFKIREGMIVGLAVTLRKKRMYDFLDRLVNIVLPRIRDFRGLSIKNVDKNGNLNIGIKEQIVFPEISAENVKNIFGLQVTAVTTASNQEEGLELFRLLGFPLKKD